MTPQGADGPGGDLMRNIPPAGVEPDLREGPSADRFGPIAGCTIVSKNYLSLARVWNASFKRHHPGCPTFVLLVDRVDGAFDPLREDFETIEIESLRIPGFLDLAFQYSILELNTVVKPFFIEFLLRERNLDRVAYFDPDVVLFAPIDRAREALASQSIVLVPHILKPMPSDGKRPNEIDFLVSGTYNLGFLAVRRSAETHAFLRWWQARLIEHGFAAPEYGLFTDQKWVDLAPSLFSRVLVLKDRGYNVAYWNLQERMDLAQENGHFSFPETPLVFFHFSGFRVDRPEQISAHQNRFRLSDLDSVFQRLFADYAMALRQAGFEITKAWRYAFEFFEDGTRIHPLWRRMHRESGQAGRGSNPFRTGPGSFEEWLLAPARRGGRIPRFLDGIYRQRPDLQDRYPDSEGEDADRLAEWALSILPTEYGIEEPFVGSLRAVVEPSQTGIRRKKGSGLPGRFGTRLTGSSHYQASLRLLRNLLAQRAQRLEKWSFASTLGPRQERWLRARAELTTLQEILRDVAREREGDAALPTTRRGRLVSRALGEQRFRAARRALWRFREWSQVEPRPASAPAARALSWTSSLDPALPFGVNLVGYLDTESGIGEIARSMARTLRQAGVPHVMRNVPQPWLRRNDLTFTQYSTSNPYAINLLVVNADQVPQVAGQLGREALAGRHNVGYWFWELSDFPSRYDPAFDYFDEIWVASRFCQEAIAKRSPIPVHRMPPGFVFPSPTDIKRSEFGLASEDFVFLYAFDGASSLRRKNPGAAVSAFRQAFPGPGKERLILKTTNTPPPKVAALRRLARRSRVDILGDYLDRNQLLGLVAAADCYVSLHRSEGFGLTLLEAMGLGKPVIATDYSGSTDFLHGGVGYPVRFRLQRLTRDFGPYPRGAQWADPDVGHAAECMSIVRSQPELAARVGDRAREETLRSWSVSARSGSVRERLRQIQVERQLRGSGGRVA